MADMNLLARIAEAACDAAINSGAEFADVSAGYSSNLSVDMEANAIKSSEARRGGGVSVRAIYKGGSGFSSCDGLDVDSAAEAGKNAARLAKLAEPDPDFVSLAKPAESYPKVEGLFDSSIGELGIKDIINFALQNIDEALAVCPDAIVSGGFGSRCSTRVFVNSLGISLAKESSSIGGHVMVIIKRGDDVGSFYDFDLARVMDDFCPTGIGESAAKQALKFLGARKIDSGIMPVVLGPLAGRSIFSSVAIAADADDVQRNRSYLKDKLGQKIASDIVTIIDDPLIPRGLNSREFDGEGSPSRPLVLVENGVLKSYFHSTYTAAKAGTETTGHGSRDGGTSPSNLVPKLGNATSEEIIKNTKEGIYINMGSLKPDKVSGEVSCSIDFGFKIENGKLAYPIKSTMIGGHFLEMLANIDAISSDYREEPGMIMPTIRIQNVQIAGAK